MANTRGKVIDTLRQRHQIEADMLGMLEVVSDSEFEEQACRIAGVGQEVIPVILRNLDTPNSRMVGVLGAISTHLDAHGIRLALRKVAASRRCSDRERMAAILILDRFLDEELEDEFFEGLKNPQEMAIQSLSEMLDEAEQSRLVLIDYLQMLDEQPIDVVLAIADALQRSQGERMVEPLRLLAQDGRLEVVKEAIQSLGMIRTPQAARALQSLTNGLSGTARGWAERSLRKLALCGVGISPLPKPDGEWRCLVSPVDGEGNQSVWFIGTSPVQPTCRFLRVLLNDTSGMVEAIGDDRAQARHFPAKRRKGSLHIFALADAPLDAIVMEADFDYGRRLVRESLRLNESSPAPLPSAYRLFSDFLWGYDDAGMSAERHLPGLDPETAYELTPYTGSLLDHPAFAIWYSQDKSIYRQAVRLLCQHRNAFKRNSMAWFKQIVDSCFDSRAKVRYASQLEKMSEWLSLLGDDWAAEMALAASLTIQDTALENHPFLTRLVESSFRQAREDMQRGLGREW